MTKKGPAEAAHEIEYFEDCGGTSDTLYEPQDVRNLKLYSENDKIVSSYTGGIMEDALSISEPVVNSSNGDNDGESHQGNAEQNVSYTKQDGRNGSINEPRTNSLVNEIVAKDLELVDIESEGETADLRVDKDSNEEERKVQMDGSDRKMDEINEILSFLPNNGSFCEKLMVNDPNNRWVCDPYAFEYGDYSYPSTALPDDLDLSPELVSEDSTNKVFHTFDTISGGNLVYEGEVLVQDESREIYCRHGFGIATSPDDGSVQLGTWDSDQLHGYGVSTQEFPKAEVYEGCFAFGQRHGYGVCHYEDGSIYKGEWENGAPCGIGKVEFTNYAHDPRQAISGFFMRGIFLHDFHSFDLERKEDEDAEESYMYKEQERVPEAHISPYEAPYDFEWSQGVYSQPESGIRLAFMKIESSVRDRKRKWFHKFKLYVTSISQSRCDHVQSMVTLARRAALKSQERAQRSCIEEEVEKYGQLDWVKEALKLKDRYAKDTEERLRMKRYLAKAIAMEYSAQESEFSQDKLVKRMTEYLTILEKAENHAKICKRSARKLDKEIHDLRDEGEDLRIRLIKANRYLGLAQDYVDEVMAFVEESTNDRMKRRIARKSRKITTAIPSSPREEPLMYLCGRPGCKCGIPKDTFILISRLFNGEM